MVGFTLGIVAQNNDPQKRGRVKVFIPHLSMNLLEGWDNLNENKSFEDLSDPFIKDVIDKIKDQLPWANCAAPIFGETGNHYFNASSKTTDKSDDKKAKNYEDSPPTDKFGKSYTPSAYNDSAKGLFSIPKVGSRVWVFFENSNLNRPVYFATTYDKDDWETINKESGDYPDELENNPDGSDTAHKNKTVISQNGAVIEIINTDDEEEIKITHHSGSYISWQNNLNEEFVEGSEQKLIQGGQSLHVGGNMNIYVGGNADVQIAGSSNINVTKECNISSDTLIDMTAPNISLHGLILLDGALTQGTIGNQGATLFGPLTVTEDVTAGSISLKTHVHGNSSPPS